MDIRTVLMNTEELLDDFFSSMGSDVWPVVPSLIIAAIIHTDLVYSHNDFQTVCKEFVIVQMEIYPVSKIRQKLVED